MMLSEISGEGRPMSYVPVPAAALPMPQWATQASTAAPAAAATQSHADSPAAALPMPQWATPASTAAPVSAAMPTSAAVHTTAPSLELPASVISGGADSLPIGTSLSFASTSGSLAVGSVFSSDSGAGLAPMDTGHAAALPFTGDGDGGEAPFYTASNEASWVFTADFSGDWFFFA